MNQPIFINAGKFISQGRGKHPTRVIDSTELIYVVSGSLKMFYGKKDYDISAGEFLFISPGVRHGGRETFQDNLVFFWIHFHAGKESFPDTGKVAYPEKMAAVFDTVLSEQQNRNDQFVCGRLLELLLYETSVKLPCPAQNNGNAINHLAASAKRIITLRYTDNISTAELAELLRCNANYLGRLYKKSYNISILDDLNKIRLKHAAQFLRETPSSVKEIAFSCGFNDIAYFRRRFFREYAMRPGEYRKLYSANHINTE